MRVVLLEDDHLQAEAILTEVRKEFRLAPEDVKSIRTESEFQTRLDELIAWRPDVFVLDVLVRWCDPQREMPEQPSKFKEQGPIGGIRCQQLLAERTTEKGLRPTPTVFYTVVRESDLLANIGNQPGNVTVIPKSEKISRLLEYIHDISRQAGKG